MERLTKVLGGSVVFPTEFVGKTLLPNDKTMYALLTKLAAYENTGLTPEEVESLVSVREISPEAEYAVDKHANTIIDKLDALLKNDDGWMPVEESLPTDRNDVLVVALFDGGWQTRVGSYIEGQWVVQTMAGCIYGRPVSHWRPLPEPPEVK